MKRLFALLLCVCALPCAAEEINHDQLSKTLGHLLVRHLQQPGFECNFDQVIQGIKDEQAGKEAPMSEEEYEQVIYAIQENTFLQTAEKNLAQADAFLQENKKDTGVQELDPKLQFRVMKKGEGSEVGPESIPLIHYKGTLVDGTIFANSDDPLPLPIQQSIPGFARGIVGMKEGERRTLYIHPEMAYGISGNLPPNSLLIFEVEVVKANSDPFKDLAQK